MTKNEYLSQLRFELNRNKITESEDIIGEYEQHFAFKLADGFTEEEIAAKLGSPVTIAAQFASDEQEKNPRSGGKVFMTIAMSFAAVFAITAYVLFFVWTVAVYASSLVSAGIGVVLIGHFNIAGLIPYMPYPSALIFGVCFLAFAVFLAAGAYYFFVYTKQIVKASIRWHRNVISGNPLPPLPWNPQFAVKTGRRLRTVLLWSATVFGTTFMLAMIVSQVLSGAWGFWHAWNWFVN
ncbi:MAG: DUF1700 domain-containing protein [Clostridiaceae bacterium]|nr:DUF1700 domain-containing protein [Clostridiaceae bacterium]